MQKCGFIEKWTATPIFMKRDGFYYLFIKNYSGSSVNKQAKLTIWNYF